MSARHELASLPIEKFCEGAVRLERPAQLGAVGVNVNALQRFANLKCGVFEGPCSIHASMLGEVHFGAFSYVGSGEISHARIGRFCSIANSVTIGPAEHPTGWLSSHPFQYNGTRRLGPPYEAWRGTGRFRAYGARPVQIGNDVWIGGNALIRRACQVGHGAIVAAGAVISRDVAPYGVAAGVPGRILKFRLDEALRERLLRLEWWNWNLAPISAALRYEDPADSADRIEAAIAEGRLEPAAFQGAVVRRAPDGLLWMAPF